MRGFGSSPRGRGPRRQRGAAAVEFALVVPILLALFFGIIDYGLWFNNALGARQGVREGARQGVVAKFNDGTTCTSGSSLTQLACSTDKAIAPLNGTAYTKVVVPSAGWKQGEQLLVCSIVKSASFTGLTPLPNGGQVKTATRMSIEVVPGTSVPAASEIVNEAPSLDWGFCS